MNVHIPWTTRLLGGLLGCLLLVLFLPSSPVQASPPGSVSSANQYDTTRTDIDQFDIVRARSYYSRWTTAGCTDDDDIDDGCYVEVTADSDLRAYISERRRDSGLSYTAIWRNLFEDVLCDHLSNRDSYPELNEDFNDCWERGSTQGDAEVEWPQIDTNEYFSANGFCKSGGPVCSITITICYNADECDGRSSNDDEFEIDDGRKADFFDANESCLFDVSQSRFTECVNRGLKRVYDYLRNRGLYTYSALENELEERGVAIDAYTTSLAQVRDTSYFAAYRPVYPAPPVVRSGAAPVYGPSGHYIVASLTQHLEAEPYTSVCGTTQGCIKVIGQSQFFRSYMGNLFVHITNPSVLHCMARRGYGHSGGYEVAFSNADLAACDERMARASSVCPAPGTGAKSELLTMYNLGLLSNLISPTLAHAMQNELNAAAHTAPHCLCNAGFRNWNVLTSTSSTNNPWEAGAIVSTARVCY